MENENETELKRQKIESPCFSEIFKMAVSIIIAVGGIVWAIILFMAGMRGLPDRVERVEKEVIVMKSDISGINAKLDGVSKNTERILEVMMKK